jgi:hypothetical protein
VGGEGLGLCGHEPTIQGDRLDCQPFRRLVS